MNLIFLIIVILLRGIEAQGPYYPNHWYGANSFVLLYFSFFYLTAQRAEKNQSRYSDPHQANVRSGVVPDWGPVPVTNAGTLAPHVCGFNPFTRKCMDPENYCPGRCMNFRYTYNTLYDCRCLVVNK